MGFPLVCVLSDEAHTREYVCKICLELVEQPVAYTKCSHVFCNSCLTQWFKTKNENNNPSSSSAGAVGDDEFADAINAAQNTRA